MAELEDEKALLAPDSPRDDEGELRSSFVEAAAASIEAGDAGALRALAGDLHEADLGALIEALEADQRTRLVELLGDDFDFVALTEVDEKVREMHKKLINISQM